MKWFLILVIVFATVGSDLLQSFEMKRSGAGGSVKRSVGALARPLLILSIVLLAISFFAFVKVLSMAPVSFVVPATAITYVFDAILARFLLGEHVDLKRWAGILLLIVGIGIISLT